MSLFHSRFESVLICELHDTLNAVRLLSFIITDTYTCSDYIHNVTLFQFREGYVGLIQAQSINGKHVFIIKKRFPIE
jgi:hypothetical protein